MRKKLLIFVLILVLLYIVNYGFVLFFGAIPVGIGPMPVNPPDAATECSYQSCRNRCELNDTPVNQEIPCPVFSFGGNHDVYYCILKENSCERRLKPFCIVVLNRWFYCSNFKSYSIHF